MRCQVRGRPALEKVPSCHQQLRIDRLGQQEFGDRSVAGAPGLLPPDQDALGEPWIWAEAGPVLQLPLLLADR